MKVSLPRIDPAAPDAAIATLEALSSVINVLIAALERPNAVDANQLTLDLSRRLPAPPIEELVRDHLDALAPDRELPL